MSFVSRFAGYFLLGTGILGLVLCVFGLLAYVILVGDAEQALDRRLQVLSEALTATSDGLKVADQFL